MSKYYHPDTDYWREYEIKPPEATAHGTEEEILSNLKQLKPNTWHLEGNKLIGMTEMGKLVQFIPTDYICTGTDSNGLPKLQRVVL